MAIAPHSSTLAWKIPWTEEPGRLQSMGFLRVGHDWVTSLSLFTFVHWRRKWQPTPVFLPGKYQGQGSLVGCRLWVAQSRTLLKRLSSSSSILGSHIKSSHWQLSSHLAASLGRKHFLENFLSPSMWADSEENEMTMCFCWPIWCWVAEIL